MIQIRRCRCAFCTTHRDRRYRVANQGRGRLELQVGAQTWHISEEEARKLRNHLNRMRLCDDEKR